MQPLVLLKCFRSNDFSTILKYISVEIHFIIKTTVDTKLTLIWIILHEQKYCTFVAAKSKSVDGKRIANIELDTKEDRGWTLLN